MANEVCLSVPFSCVATSEAILQDTSASSIEATLRRMMGLAESTEWRKRVIRHLLSNNGWAVRELARSM
jgi:hypothetical protein